MKKDTRFNFSQLGRRILGGLIAFHPMISAIAWEQTFVFILVAFVLEIGGPLNFYQLDAISPSRETAETLLFDFAIFGFSDSINHTKTYFASHDKADATKGAGGRVKLLATFDDRLTSKEFPDGRIVCATLDADKSSDTPTNVAESVSHSVDKLELDDDAECHSVTINSGGGGTVEAGMRALVDLGQM